MVTSNKLLLGFLLALVAIPVLLLMSFRSKISAKKYIVRKYAWIGNESAKGFANNGAIVLEADSISQINSRFYLSDTAEYSFRGNEGSDSLLVFTQADGSTLFKLQVHRAAGDNSLYEKDLAIGLPALRNVKAKNASIDLGDLVTTGPMMIQLLEGGLLAGQQDRSEDGHQKIKYGPLDIDATNAEIKLSSGADYSIVHLRLAGNSKLSTMSNLKIDSLSGQISDSTLIELPFHLLHNLQSTSTH